MKIVCDNCSAKYSIADEKVAGKVFKIRCKKCTNVIVVRGDQLGAEEQAAAPAQGFDYGGEAVWHVVIDGDQQGPYAPAQIGQLLTDGSIDWEAYVWREGFDGWKPARDVPELVTAITGGAPQEPAAAAAPAGIDPMAATAAAAQPLQQDPMGADPFAAAGDAFGGGAFDGAPTEAAREAPGGDAGADLFAQADAGGSPFGGADDVVASAPSPRVSTEDAMTGQRNENSVLFSLSNLQALATGGGGDGGGAAAPAPAGGPPPGHASGEGSGLIDIRALASATASTSGPSAASSSPSGGASDLLSIGGGGGGLGSSLGAPVLAPAAAEPEKNNKGMIIGIGVAAVMVVGLLVALIVVLTQQPEPVASAATPATETTNSTETAVAPAVDPATMDMPAAGAPVTSEMAAPEAAMTEEAASNDSNSGSRMRRRGSMRGTSTSAMSDPDPIAPTMMTSRMASGSIDDLLNQALGGMMSSAMMTAAMMNSNLPQQPGRDDVGRALRGVSGRVASCGNGTSGVANAAITFANSGRVRSVRVTGVPPAVQSCVARTVRSARVSPFQRATFNVNFPFRVR